MSEWQVHDDGIEFIEPKKRSDFYLKSLLNRKGNTSSCYYFERKIKSEDCYLTNGKGLICHIPLSELEKLDYPCSIGCLETKKNGEKDLSVVHMYFLGVLNEKPQVRTVSKGFKIQGMVLEEDSGLFAISNSKEKTSKKRKKAPITFRDTPLIWVYVYSFDPPTHEDLHFLSAFDMIQNAKLRLVTLQKISTGQWTSREQLMHHPIDSISDWRRDRFVIQFLIISLGTPQLAQHVEWYVHSEGMVLKNNLLLINTIDDKILTMTMNGEKGRCFDVQYLVDRHKERILESIRSVDLSLIDSKLIESYNEVWDDRNKIKEQLDMFNKKDDKWIKIDHVTKKVLPPRFQKPAELDDSDARLFNLDYVFGLK